jgi:hypothetical protein
MKEVMLLLILFMIFILITIIITPILHHHKSQQHTTTHQTDDYCISESYPNEINNNEKSKEFLKVLCQQQNHSQIHIFVHNETQFLTKTEIDNKQDIHNKMLHFFTPSELAYHNTPTHNFNLNKNIPS